MSEGAVKDAKPPCVPSSASVAIWNLCHPSITPTRVFLRDKRIFFRSSEPGNILRTFLESLEHHNSCRPWLVSLSGLVEGGHTARVVANRGDIMTMFNGQRVPDERAANGMKLNHGDRLRLYYKLFDQRRHAGPFVFEYLEAEKQESIIELQDIQNEVESLEADVEEKNEAEKTKQKQTQPPRNFLQLPTEIYPIIFSFLPPHEVVMNISAVSCLLNEVVQKGFHFRQIKIPNKTSFTVEERNVFKRILDTCPPSSIGIHGIKLNWDGQPMSTAWDFYTHNFTKQADTVELTLTCDAMIPPSLELSRILPVSTLRRVKVLEVKGAFDVIALRDAGFQHLEELRIYAETVDLAAIFQRDNARSFHNLKILRVFGSPHFDLLEDFRPSPQYLMIVPLETLQLSFSLKFPFYLVGQSLKTLIVHLEAGDHLECSKALRKLQGVNNLSLIVTYGFGESVNHQEIFWLLSSLPYSIKVLHLQLKLFSDTLLDLIAKFEHLEFFLGDFQVVDDVTAGGVRLLGENCPSLKGVRFQQKTRDAFVEKDELVEDKFRKTEDFWQKKIKAVFGTLAGNETRFESTDPPFEVWEDFE